MPNKALLDELKQLIAQRIGLRIPDDARDRFADILRERTAHLGYSSLKDYRTFLVGGHAIEEWEDIARLFTTGETFFFRDHGQFDLLRLRLLPELIAQHRHDKTLRLWSAGCASGEEVYSLAMLVDMLLPERSDWNVLILGTDIDSKAIARAQHGRYGQWSFRMIPAESQQRYFHPEGNEWVLNERIRRMATFRVTNLVHDPFPDPRSELRDMDLILCRNVFIYFDPAATYTVAAKFAATLHEGGYLLTGHTELIGHPVRELESRLFAEGVVYQRRLRVPAESLYSPHLNLLPTAGNVRAQLIAPLRKLDVELTPTHAGGGNFSQFIAPPATAQATHPAPIPLARNDDLLFKEARVHADRGEFDLAEQACRKALAANPLAAAPYFLLAQLAQVKGDFNQAKECLNKAIYLDSRFVAAYLELAALCERAEDIPRAQTLRCAALGIVRTMPNDEVIEQYETTAGEMMQWLAQWEHEPVEGASKSEFKELKS